ncbi:MAG: ACR3 family arsenite efflux transporter [Burkholderiales bacterium]|nr:ACR3 family arsenite efflux transporter [Burkholderiales bacterium]
MADRMFNVLFLCTGNSARSILGEAILNSSGKGRFRAFSAGSHPAGKVNPYAIELLQKQEIAVGELRSKSWDEFSGPAAPKLDFVFTVCDNAAGEVCPFWPGQPMTAHWGIPDPAAVAGTDEQKRKAFLQAYMQLNTRIGQFLSLPMNRIDKLSLQAKLDAIGKLREDGELNMSAQSNVIPSPAASAPMSVFERYLTLWVFLCILAGIVFGQALPDLFHALGRMEVARVNLPVGLLIWVMIIPMLVKVDFGALHEVRQHVRGIGVTLLVNWLVKPFSMAFLGWLFVRNLFAPMLPAEQLDSYIAGLILLAAAPCTAMVFVWSRLSNGDPLFTLSQVALNDTIMVFAFAPIVALLLGISAISVPWDTLVTSVVLYIVIPLAVAQIWRKRLLAQGQAHFDAIMAKISPWSIGALLATLVLLFAFQGKAIIEQPLIIALLAVPILIQVFFNSALAYWLNRAVGETHNVACPSALIGASNFFELAVAAAISLFGFESGAALATVVGVLIEVPVMLLVVKVVNSTRGWYERGI